MNNNVLAKTMENICNHRDMKVVMTQKKYLKYATKPYFEEGSVKTWWLLTKKSVYLGQASLDLSKLLMYEFHYDYMLPKYGEKL